MDLGLTSDAHCSNMMLFDNEWSCFRTENTSLMHNVQIGPGLFPFEQGEGGHIGWSRTTLVQPQHWSLHMAGTGSTRQFLPNEVLAVGLLCHTTTKEPNWHSSLMSLPTITFTYSCPVFFPIFLNVEYLKYNKHPVVTLNFQNEKHSWKWYKVAVCKSFRRDKRDLCQLGPLVVVQGFWPQGLSQHSWRLQVTVTILVAPKPGIWLTYL